MTSSLKKRTKSKKEKDPARSYSDLMNDPAKRGIDRIIEAQELTSSTAESSEIVSRENLIATGVIAPKFSVEKITVFSRELLAKIKSLTTEQIPIHSISENLYRVEGFGSRYQRGETQNLARQIKIEDGPLSDAALINPPLIYEDESKTRACVSGWKRIKAAKEIGIADIECRVLKYRDIHEPLQIHGLANEKNAALKAAFTHIVYSESEHNSPLSDIAVLNYFYETVNNHLFQREDFHEVLKLIGCNRKSPRYNDLYRLWKIACQPEAYSLIKEKKVRIGLFKKHTNIDVMYHRPVKVNAIKQKIDEYIARIRASGDKDEVGFDPIELKLYDESEIQTIIFEIDQPHLSKDDIEARKYRSPKKNIRIQDSKIELQSFRINFADKSDHNVRNIIETLYVLESVVKDLRDYTAAFKNGSAGPFEKPTPPSHRGTHIVYGEKYYDFIRKNNLWNFCDLFTMSSYLQTKGDFTVKADELKAINKLPAAERAKRLIQEFRKYGAIRDGKDIEHEHLVANATDQTTKKHKAPRLEPLEDEVNGDIEVPKTQKVKK